MAYNWVQKLAPASLTATSDPRVHAVADAANSREWFMFRQASVTAGTGKLWRYASGSLSQLSGGPAGWTYYYAVNYDTTANQICVTSERKIATSSPSGSPSWSETDIGGSSAKHFTSKPIRRLDASGWLVANAPHQTSSTNIGWYTDGAQGLGGYNSTSQNFLAAQVASAKVSSTQAAICAMYNDGTFVIAGIDNTCTPGNGNKSFSNINNSSAQVNGVSQILPGVPCVAASKSLFTVTDGTDTSCISIASNGTATVIEFAASLIRPGIETNLTSQAQNRIYLIRSDGRMYESNSTVTSFSLLATSSVPQLSVGGNTALHMYLDYENKPSVILSDGSVYQLTTSTISRRGGIKGGCGF